MAGIGIRLGTLARLAVLGGLVVGAAGCSGAAGPSAAAITQRQIESAGVRLRGAWVLQRFRPDTSLEPMLAAMLEYQFGRLIVKFDGKRFVADSPGLHVDRAYQIVDSNGEQFKVTSFDEQGVAYDAFASFVTDSTVELHSTTSPWKGFGTLVRVGM